MIIYKNIPGKKSYYSRKCMRTEDACPMQKKRRLIVNNMAIFNLQMHRKNPFYENVSDSLRGFNSYLLRLYWQSSSYFRKRPRYLKLNDIFSEDFGNWDFLPKFFFSNFFSVTFCHPFKYSLKFFNLIF